MSRSSVAVLLFAFLTLYAATFPAERTALSLVMTIPLPGVTGRFDHFALDVRGHRLFVAALGNNTLEAIDLAAGKRLQSIAGLPKPTGVLYLPDRNELFVACGDGFVDIIGQQDSDNYERLERIPTASGSRTSFFAHDLGQFFLAMPERGAQKAEIRIFEVR